MDEKDHKSYRIAETSSLYGSTSRKNEKYTIADYNRISEEKRYELIRGSLYEMKAPSFVHQHISSVLYNALSSFIKEQKGSCIALSAPVDVRLFRDDYTMVQPDILILCDRSKIRRWGIDGAPDLVMEIVSPATARKDYTVKVDLYMSAGVKELWLIDPINSRLLIYYAEEDRFPYIGPLSGKKEIGLYENALLIDLDEIAALMQEYPQ